MAVLVTGASGYLGSYVAAGLLTREESLNVLVRASTRAEAEEKLWRAWQLHMDSAAFARWLGRLRIFPGDLTREDFGLPADERRDLVASTNSIVHVAAALNRRSERACLNVNVRGTLAVLKLARAAHEHHGLRRFSHVSTTSVAGERMHAVVREEARTKSLAASIRRGIESARNEARSIGRFVNTDTLTALPSKHHGEQMLADLLRRHTPVAVAVINVEGLQAIERKFDRKAADGVVREFASRLERHLPPAVHLYRWGAATFAVFANRATEEELREVLSQFALALASEPISLNETANRPVKIKPVYVVKQEQPGADARTVQATIDGFCAGGSKLE